MTLDELIQEHPELNKDNILFEDKGDYSSSRVTKFWEHIRLLRYGYHNNDFTNIEFPEFESHNYSNDKILQHPANFWKQNDVLELTDAIFSHCVFWDNVDFNNVLFQGEKTLFSHSQFLNQAMFNGAKFVSTKVEFNYIDFRGDCSFSVKSESQEIHFVECTFHNKVTFTHSQFNKKNSRLLFEDCSFEKTMLFSYSQFYGKVVFWGVGFLGKSAKISFGGSTFYDELSFSQSIFPGSGHIDFIGVKFKGKENNLDQLDMSNYVVDFRKTSLVNIKFDGSKFGTLLLDESYDYDSSFMHVKVENGDRAAFRLLKYFHKEIHDEITANKYYAREMEAYEKEQGISWNDRIVLWFGRIFSNHHQNWFLPIVWILFFGSQISVLENLDGILYWNIFGLSLFIAFFSTLIKQTIPKITILLIPILFMNIPIENALNELAVHINPLNIFKSDDLYCGVEAPVLFFKILIGFAIYHFIVSVRKFSGK